MRYVGPLIALAGLLHAGTGVLEYGDALAAIVRDGFVDAVDPHADRGRAFWFMLLSPILLGVGWAVHHGYRRSDRALLLVLGWLCLSISVVGAAAIPLSGFWIVLFLAIPLLRHAHGLPRAAPASPAG